MRRDRRISRRCWGMSSISDSQVVGWPGLIPLVKLTLAKALVRWIRFTQRDTDDTPEKINHDKTRAELSKCEQRRGVK